VKWDGLEEVSLFHRPKANVLISVSGIPQGRLDIPHEFYYRTIEVQCTTKVIGTDLIHGRSDHCHWFL